MGRRRRRRRSRGSRPLVRAAVVVAIALFAVSAVAVPTVSFTAVTVDRAGNTDVVTDEYGAVGLDVAGNVTRNETGRLVNVTNRVSTDTSVTVALRDASADEADLVLDGQVVGNETTFTLSASEERRVDVAVEGDAGDTLHFDTTASSSGITVETLNRSTTVEGTA